MSLDITWRCSRSKMVPYRERFINEAATTQSKAEWPDDTHAILAGSSVEDIGRWVFGRCLST